MRNVKQGLGSVKMILLALAVGAGAWGCSGGSSTPLPTPTPTPTPAPTPTPNPTATVTGISPKTAPAGALAFTLTVTGTNFLPTSTVQWDSSTRTTTFVSATQLKANITATDLASAGTVTVTVVNPAPGGGNSNGSTFTIAPDTIAFTSGRALNGTDAPNANSTFNVWAMGTDGSNPTPLTKLTAASVLTNGQAWSPDGSKIAFASTRALNGNDANSANGTFNIWISNADGSSPTPLTNLTAANANSSEAAWSADGSKIAFSSQRALDGSDAAIATVNIWVMNADGTKPTPVTNLTSSFNASSFTPAWSPDGTKIAFISTRALNGNDAANTNNQPNIWAVNADGSSPGPLTGYTAGNINIVNQAWSPDGTKIAFTTNGALDGSGAPNTNLTANVWVMNANGLQGTPLTQMTALNSDSDQPVWSPDGSKIAFASLRALDGSNNANPNLTSNLWVVNADGTSATPVTKLSGGAETIDPLWSPDGTKIFFSSTRAFNGSDAKNATGILDCWVANADGSSATPLTQLINASCLLPRQP